MSSKPRKSKMPKLRIPVAPPGYRHPSKKDYERVKKVDHVEDYNDEDHFFYDHDEEEYEAENDLMFVLNKFGIKSAVTTRIANYG